jgi:hypothetical protein
MEGRCGVESFQWRRWYCRLYVLGTLEVLRGRLNKSVTGVDIS